MTASSGGGLRVDHTLDLRGMAGPAGYQRALDQLGAMEENEVLELSLDEGDALNTIPYGLRAEGHEILVSEPTQQSVRLLVRKRSLLAQQ